MRNSQLPLPLWIAVFGLVLSISIVLSPSAGAATRLDSKRFAAIALDATTGEVLYARDADAQRYPASLTKVMTLYLAFDALDRGDLKLSDPVIISPRAAARPPSKLGLPAGQRLTVQEAINILVVKSANDVATALGETLAGNEGAFARQMTARAKALGMNHTVFRNASGLPDPGHVSTARDLAILARAFLRDHPDDYRVFDQEQTTFRGRLIPGHNALLRRPGIDGFKTGFTNASGFNLLTSGARDGHRIIAVVLGGRTARGRDLFMRDLMRASFASLTVRDAGLEVKVASLLDADYAPLTVHPSLDRAKAEPAPEPRAQATLGDQIPSSSAPPKWWIQVGAFSSADRGQARLRDVRDRHPRHFGDAPEQLERIDGLYQARFASVSAGQAKAACALLTAEGDRCMVTSNP
ncbi:D-alanyl-D-alanine carboxypeptidase [Caulobacter sp. UC70_42]|uniref:D-alanyl-D-alanine carboxypeptidase n=1 Tax=Caulobacter sp. UC70_42 TaxID=3374551 RepID=UPI00375822C0